MNKQKTSHDILNLLERLKIMLDLAKEGQFEAISKKELESDLTSTLRELEEKFKVMIQ